MIVFFSGCDNWGIDEPGLPDIAPFVKGDTVSRTLLVYMMAENSLTDDLEGDYDEIKIAALGLPDDVRLFVFFDNSDTTRLPALYQYHPYAGEVVENKVFSFDRDVCSSDTATLAKILDVIFDDYPTREFDIIMGSHASGWIRRPQNAVQQRTIGVDNGKNTYSDKITTTIEIEELASLLESLPVKVDRLMFDACLMQGVETAYALRNSANWIIGSPAEIPGYGAPYDKVVPLFFGKHSNVEDIMYEYKMFYDNTLNGVVLSVVCASFMQELAECSRSYIKKYFAQAVENDYSSCLAYVPGAAYDGTPSYPAYYDMNAVMKLLLGDDEYATWKGVFDRALPCVMVSNSKYVYSGIVRRRVMVDATECGGMSMYVPQDRSKNAIFNEEFKTTEWYRAAGWDEAGW